MTDARSLTQTLGGTWYRYYGKAPCPVCQPERRNSQGALTLTDGDTHLLAHCKKSACAYVDILRAAGIAFGRFAPPDPALVAQRKADRAAEDKRRSNRAVAIHQETQPIDGTLAETYLRRRGITCALPGTLRFHPACFHGTTATRHPAMVARIEGGAGFAIHRTYLRADGAGKAGLTPDKAMLGPVSGGAVRLTDEPGPLVVTEGIETALSLACGLLQRPSTIWAALSTSGMRGLILPPSPGRLTIAPDGDEPGRSAAYALAKRAHAAGWKVSLLDPGDEADWNDHLIRKEV